MSALLSRRHALHVGGLSAVGLTLPRLLEAEANGARRGGPKSCIYLFLYGGVSQIDTFDMKPDAPAEFRGEFRPAPTAVPGTRVCELLPRTARLADRYTIVRITTDRPTFHGATDVHLALDPRTGRLRIIGIWRP